MAPLQYNTAFMPTLTTSHGFTEQHHQQHHYLHDQLLQPRHPLQPSFSWLESGRSSFLSKPKAVTITKRVKMCINRQKQHYNRLDSGYSSNSTTSCISISQDPAVTVEGHNVEEVHPQIQQHVDNQVEDHSLLQAVFGYAIEGVRLSTQSSKLQKHFSHFEFPQENPSSPFLSSSYLDYFYNAYFDIDSYLSTLSKLPIAETAYELNLIPSSNSATPYETSCYLGSLGKVAQRFERSYRADTSGFTSSSSLSKIQNKGGDLVMYKTGWENYYFDEDDDDSKNHELDQHQHLAYTTIDEDLRNDALADQERQQEQLKQQQQPQQVQSQHELALLQQQKQAKKEKQQQQQQLQLPQQKQDQTQEHEDSDGDGESCKSSYKSKFQQRHKKLTKYTVAKTLSASETRKLLFLAGKIAKNKKYEEARSMFVACTRSDPTNCRAWLGWAKLEAQVRNYSKAKSLFRTGLAIDPKNTYLWQGLGELEKQMGNVDAACEIFETACEIAGDSNVHLIQPWGHLESQRRNFEKARYLFKKALGIDPTHGPTYHAWAKMEAYLVGNKDLARSIFEQGTCYNPDCHGLWLAWAQLEARMQNMVKARKCFGIAVSIDTNNPKTWHAWACEEDKCGDPQRARELFRYGADLSPKCSLIWREWALMEERLGNFEFAKVILEKGLAIEPSNELLWHSLATIEMNLGNFEKAREIFWTASQRVQSEGCLQFYQAWGDLEARLGKLERARELFQEGISRDKTADIHAQVLVYHAWATAELRKGFITNARILYNKALKLDPVNSHVLQSLGLLELREGDLKKAKELLDRGIKRHPDDPALLSAAAELVWKRSDHSTPQKVELAKSKARGIMRQAVNVDSTDYVTFRSWADLEKEMGNDTMSKKLIKKANQLKYQGSAKA